MQDLGGKVAVITGGASGIGLATARELAGHDVSLVLADVEESALSRAVAALTREGARAIGVVTDVTDRSAVERLADRTWAEFGAAHIVFNNAGVAVFGPVQSMTHQDWQWTINVNLWGPIHGVEVFVPRIIDQRQGGHVLFTASFAGLVANRALGPYSVSKAGVVSLAECLAKDVREHDIGVSVLCPMRVATNIDDSFRNRPEELGGPVEQTYADKESGSLIGRTLEVGPVAKLVVDAIRHDVLYVLTHQETEVFVAKRMERLREAARRAL